MAGRLEEVEEQALRHGKKIIAKLEERVRAMEGDLGEQSTQTIHATRKESFINQGASSARAQSHATFHFFVEYFPHVLIFQSPWPLSKNSKGRAI